MSVNLHGLDRQAERTMIDLLIANGALRVTRCPDGAKQSDSCIRYKSGGGMLPGHLDPRFIGESREEREAREREQIVDRNNAATSRRKRVKGRA